MEQCFSTHQHLKKSIAEKLADVTNGSVSQFFDKGGCVEGKTLPLLSFLQAVKKPPDKKLKSSLGRRFSWLSDVDLILSDFRISWESKTTAVPRVSFLSEVSEDWEMIQGNLEAIYNVTMEKHPKEQVPIFVKILQGLDPYSLNLLEKYLRSKGDAELQLSAIEDVWRDLCLKHEINILRNQEPESGVPYPWKIYFIARHFKRCMKEKGNERNPVQTMLGLSLLFDNQEEINKTSVMMLADLETDTL